MPCDTTLTQGQTAEGRQREIDSALADLERRLTAGKVRLVVGPNGEIAFTDWGAQRMGVTDVCAFRTLSTRGSWPLRQAQAAAEMAAGRTVDRAKVAAGVHSHDGGGSWHPGH